MSDVASGQLQYLIGELGRFANHHIKLIREAAEQAQELADDLKYFNAFLRCASKKVIEEDTMNKQFVRDIRYLVYDAEDTVDTFLTQAASAKAATWVRRLHNNIIGLDRIAQKIQKVRRDVEDKHGGRDSLEQLLRGLADEVDEKPEASSTAKDKKNVVGLDGPASEIIGILKQNTARLDIVSIVGMPGLGKSTLAGKILRDPTLEYEFPKRFWVYVSKFTPKDVFLSILGEYTTVTEDMRSKEEHELAKKVKEHLERGKFLIVMDDVWTPKRWEKVSACLPTTNNLGKIIITSRHLDVAWSANPQRKPYEMKLLGDSHSIELLQYEVFGEPKWDPLIKPHGEIIALQCKGLPLAIVVIGGIIKKEVLGAATNTQKADAWQNFEKKVKDHLKSDVDKIMDGVISWSYRELPDQLKPCFLYFGMFPEDVEIQTWKLLRLWIAEGFVLQVNNSSLEDTAQSYLEELVRRNLIKADKRSPNGKIKTCLIHDSLRDFCTKQAGQDEECFLVEIKKSADDGKLPIVHKNETLRRISIHSNVLDFISSKPSGRRVRSFVCFSKEDLELETQHISAIPGGFKLLRVLDARPIKFPRIPVDVYELLHLRYIHMSFKAEKDPAKLPKKFSDLVNMQTLVVDTSRRNLQIEADIWKMINLRTVKTKAIATLPKPARDDAENEHGIQTLGTISPESCTDAVFRKARRLRKVSVRGNLDILINGNNNNNREGEASFEHMKILSDLEKLKLQNDTFPRPAAECKMSHLPSPHSFPPNLKALTLTNTYLNWSQMSVLSSLLNLEVLKLKENAFFGDYWEVADGGFRKLRVLYIMGHTDLVLWKMSASNFPSIMHLELRNCEKLRTIPIEFAEKEYLDVLIVNYCPSAAASAEKIRDIKKGEGKEFKLEIFPPISS